MLALAACCAGCGPAGDGDGGVDLAVAVADPHLVYPAPHPAGPQDEKGTGTVLSSPKIVPIVFSGDPALPSIQAFTGALGASDYWRATTAEYGVAAATASAPIVVSPTEIGATMTVKDIETFLATHLDGTHAGWPTPDASSIYILFFPTGITVQNGSVTSNSCVNFNGFHHAAKVGGLTVAYAVIPRCVGFASLTGDDAFTVPASHELIEAATDPFTERAFARIDQDHTVWNLFPAGELADLCDVDSDAVYKPAGLGFAVQRSWSNAAVLAGLGPCVPVPDGNVYFAAVPVLTDDVDITASNFTGDLSGTTKGVQIPLGESRTIDLALFSTASLAAPFRVSMSDVPALQGGAEELTFVLDVPSGVNGDILHATITRIKNGSIGGTQFAVKATGGTKTFHYWFGYAAN